MDLRKHVALVTGGGTGVGRAISLALADAGCRLAIGFLHSEESALATAQQIRERGGEAVTFKADVASNPQVRRMMASVVGHFGGLHILVNNAATTSYASLTDLDAVSDEMWEAIWSVNVQGAFQCTRAAAPHLHESRAGKVVNIASSSAFRPSGSSIPYLTSKAALVMLTKTMARVLGPEIQVNAVAPGRMDTRWARHLPPAVREQIQSAPESPPVPVEDVARAVVFLCQTNSITGQSIVIDWGLTLL